MSAELESDSRLEIAHVLFMDIVGYSKLLVDEQSELSRRLNLSVRNTQEFRAADTAGKLVRLPTGDGMALAFFGSPEAPVRCAVQIAKELKSVPELPLRMGIHSGPVDPVTDVNDRTNVAGAGINIAQRVMDCGDAGHILLSERIAEDLGQYGRWRTHLHDLGKVEVKHGFRIAIVNLYGDDFGNPVRPKKLAGLRPSRIKRRLLTTAFLLLAALIVGLLIFGYTASRKLKVTEAAAQQSTNDIPEKSLAVLPFENLSAEKDDAFFAEGMQDDVLTSVGKIKDLTVIARSSVLAYRGGAVAGKLREIGLRLRVSHILQGSVRRLANRVVVNVQLVDARNDHQIWSERYERTMTDVLSLQGELAVAIARELHASLTPLEKAMAATKPTENPEAYLLYLRAREMETRLSPSDEEYEQSIQLYQQAIELDPKFALARARASIRMTYVTQGHAPARDAEALAQAEEALRLQATLGEARLAFAVYYFWVAADFDRALVELSRTEELMPNSGEVWQTRGVIYKRQNKLRERIDALQHAEILDPQDTTTLRLLAATFRSVRNWPEALRTAERAKALRPNERTDWGRVFGEFRQHGGLDPVKKAIATSSEPAEVLNEVRFEVAMLERDYTRAEHYLRETPAENFRFTERKLVHQALLLVARGADPTSAETALMAARQEVEKLFAENPGDNFHHGNLAMIDAFRGRKDDAIREASRCVETSDYSILERNDALALLALVYARTGESDEAIKLIEKLLTAPANLSQCWVSTITQADLKWRWVWDPIRNDPRFQKLLTGPEPKTIY